MKACVLLALFVACTAVSAPNKKPVMRPDPRLAVQVPPVPLYHDKFGCLSSSKNTSCSGNGRCVRDPSKFFGIAKVVTRRSGYCKCYRGWVGPGCAVPLSAVSRKQRIRMLAAGWMTYNAFTDEWRQTEKGARVPRYAFLATHFPSKGSTKTHYGRGLVRDSNDPHPAAIHNWVEPRAEAAAAGGRMLVDWERKNGEVGVDTPRDYHKEIVDTSPTPSPTYDPAEPRVALFTSWKGRSIVAPPIDVHQATYQAEVPRKKDVTVPKLITAFDIGQGEGRDKYGAPGRVPAEVYGIVKPPPNATHHRKHHRKHHHHHHAKPAATFAPIANNSSAIPNATTVTVSANTTKAL